MVLRPEKEDLNSISSTQMATKTFCTASSREPGGWCPLLDSSRTTHTWCTAIHSKHLCTSNKISAKLNMWHTTRKVHVRGCVVSISLFLDLSKVDLWWSSYVWVIIRSEKGSNNFSSIWLSRTVRTNPGSTYLPHSPRDAPDCFGRQHPWKGSHCFCLWYPRCQLLQSSLQ